ncbi:MAG TPA: hypothetical protein VGJ87_05595 [Roseiflexaceae bacterium]
MRRRLLLMLALSALMLSRATTAQAAERICFREVPNCIEGRFAAYWRQNGGLPVFGFPLGPAHQESVEGATYLAQLFERNRFELHPENRPPYDVLLGRLGDERLRQLGRDWRTFPKLSGPPGDLCFFSRASGHAVCSDFFVYFRTHGLSFDGRSGYSEAESIALFGLPLSEPSIETNSSGDTVMTQWFERARFEYHPKNPDPYKVLLGRLGAETAAASANNPCADIPPSVNATVTPNCFKAGTTVTARATGFDANERVSYTITPPAGANIPAFLLSGTASANAGGVVELTNSLPEGVPLGLYSITFRGATSGKTGKLYFKVIG